MGTVCTCGAAWTGHRIEHCTACHETNGGTSPWAGGARASDVMTCGDTEPHGPHQKIGDGRPCDGVIPPAKQADR